MRKYKLFSILFFFYLSNGKLIAQCPTTATCGTQNGADIISLQFPSPPPLSNNEATFEYQGQTYTFDPIVVSGTTALYPAPFCDPAGLSEDLNMSFEWLNDPCTISPPPPQIYECPQSIVCQAVQDPGLNWDCPENENIIQLVFGPTNNLPPLNEVQFYFPDNPLLDGQYNFCGQVNNGSLTAGYEIPCVQAPTTIVFAMGTESQKTCVYQGGFHCEGCDPYYGPECEMVLDACDQGLVDFVVQQLGEEVFCQQWNGACDINNTIWRDGKTAVGLYTFHDDYRLSVHGGIVTDHLRLCDENDPIYWCDYVFAEDYDLWSLYKVDEFIKKNKHLHKTKSESEIKAEGGFDLKTTTLNQQEKIEEIFLHLIELDKQLNTLENNVDKTK